MKIGQTLFHKPPLTSPLEKEGKANVYYYPHNNYTYDYQNI